MKLRNKKTGEIVECECITIFEPIYDKVLGKSVAEFYTLAELNENWEDYKPQEPLIDDDGIGKQLISSKYDSDCYWADEKQQEAFREFCRDEDSRPENQRIPSDAYSDNGLCFAKEFGGVLSGNDRPRNMSEYNAWRNGLDFKMVREENERLGKERWLHFVETNGLQKFVEHQDPLIKDKKIRKAIRAWADANEIETVAYDEYWVSFRRDDKTISFKDEDRCLGFYGLENSKDYTITELCGEEE